MNRPISPRWHQVKAKRYGSQLNNVQRRAYLRAVALNRGLNKFAKGRKLKVVKFTK